MGRLQRAVTRQPLPPGFDPAPIALDGPAFGAFAASKALTADGRVVAVPTPGHTLGHIAILVVQPDHHVLLGGDTAYDQPQLQDLQVDGVSPKDDVAIATMKTILAHAKAHPTVYLPSHDPQSVRRLRETDTLEREPLDLRWARRTGVRSGAWAGRRARPWMRVGDAAGLAEADGRWRGIGQRWGQHAATAAAVTAVAVARSPGRRLRRRRRPATACRASRSPRRP